MKEKKYGVKYKRWYRHPKTTQERKFAEEHKKYVRGKRAACNLPNTYWDIPIREEKSWKSKRAKQYRTGKRGKKHVIYLPVWAREYELKAYFEEQDIPYSIEYIRESEIIYNSWWPNGYKRSWHTETRVTYWTDKNIEFPNEVFELARQRYYYRESVYS